MHEHNTEDKLHSAPALPKPPPEPPPKSSLFVFSTQDLVAAINALDNKTSGIFHMCMLHYKWGIDFYAPALTKLFNIFVQCQFLPVALKLNVNVALPKYATTANASTKQNPSNYRYIGLQTSVFKIFDWIINNHLDKWQLTIISSMSLKEDSSVNVELWNSYFVSNMHLVVTNNYILHSLT